MRRLFLPLLASGMAVALLLQGCSTASPIKVSAQPVPSFDQALSNRIDTAVVQLMHEQQIPGLAISILKNNIVVYNKGFGIANISTGSPVTPQTIFQLGSDSKMMVGIAIMQLQAQGKINLDAPLTDYLPDFELSDTRYKNITIRQILSHRSGLPYCSDYKQCDYLDYQAPEFDDGALARHVHRSNSVDLVSEPGKKMQYSDLGFEMLGVVIARLSGESFEDYIKQHVFLPLGMAHSSFLLADIPPSTLAAPHVLNKTISINRYFPYSREHAPSSHLFSNLEDMNRFANAQLQRGHVGTTQLVPAAAYDAMWSPEIATNLPSPWEKNLGLGWFLGVNDGHRLVGHAGGDTGYASEFILAPDDSLSILVMVNREFMVEDFAFMIMQWLLGTGKVQPPTHY